MTAREFVDIVRTVVVENAAVGALRNVSSPPGRKPSAELIEIGNWFRRLGQGEQEFARKLARIAAAQAGYNFLLLLDGLLATDDAEGRLTLIYEATGQRVCINDPDRAALSALFKDVDK
jgi:YD repeat-containing protein